MYQEFPQTEPFLFSITEFGVNEKRKSIASNLYKLTSRRLIRKWPKSTSKRPHLLTFNKKVTHPSLQGWVKPLYHAGCFTFFLFVHFFWASFLDHPQKTRDGSIDVLWMLRSMTWCWEMNMKKNGLQWRRGSRWWSWFLSWGGGFDILLIQESSNGRTHWTVLERTPRKNLSI